MHGVYKIVSHDDVDHDEADSQDGHHSVGIQGNGGGLRQTHQEQDEGHHNDGEEHVIDEEQYQLLLVQHLQILQCEYNVTYRYTI